MSFNLPAKFKRIPSYFILRGKPFEWSSAITLVKDKTLWSSEELAALNMIAWMVDEQKGLTQKTSGSTGDPKDIVLTREQVEYSARQTLKFLGIAKGGIFALCISANYIGGKMMIARAILNQAILIIESPNIAPLIEGVEIASAMGQQIALTAMVPAQVVTILKGGRPATIWDKCSCCIIGGAALADSNRQALRLLETRFFESYGMTESCSHIALKEVLKSTVNESFKLLGDVLIKLNDQALSIKGSATGKSWVHTNDLVQLDKDGRGFRWLGRKDFVINSGGVKMIPESLERQLSNQLYRVNYFSKVADAKWGEALVITLLTSEGLLSKEDRHIIKETLECIMQPKYIAYLKRIPVNNSGKIDRMALVQKIAEVNDHNEHGVEEVIKFEI